jgi:hypothetical protein
MLRRIILSLCLLALVAPVVAAPAKRKAAKAAEPESALSPALAKPVSAALESLDALDEAAKHGGGKRPAAAIRKVDAVKADLKGALSAVREAKADDDESAAKDAAIVAVAAALRSADMVSQGLQEGDDDQVEAGLKLGGMARSDLEGLDEGGAEAAEGGGGGGDEYKIGPSMGGNVSLAGQTGGANMSADLSLSLPISQAMDLGIGGSLTGSSSDNGGSGVSSSTSANLGYGFNAFARYHFLELFARAPWIVPFVGLKMGINSSDNFSTSGYNVSETQSNSTTFGEQFGMLFFVNTKSAITTQLENSSVSSSSNGTSSPGSSSLSFSMGVRQMF